MSQTRLESMYRNDINYERYLFRVSSRFNELMQICINNYKLESRNQRMTEISRC